MLLLPTLHLQWTSSVLHLVVTPVLTPFLPPSPPHFSQLVQSLLQQTILLVVTPLLTPFLPPSPPHFSQLVQSLLQQIILSTRQYPH